MGQLADSQTSTRLVIGVTGHRNLRDDELEGIQEQTQRFFIDLQRRYPDLPLCLLSSLADGSDQLVTKVAMQLGIPVIAPLPFESEFYQADFESPEALALFNHQRDHAEVLVLPLGYEINSTSISKPGPERDFQYAQAGVFVSSHCHILLALWDGNESELLGGTAQVVAFHLHGTLPGTIDRRRAALGMLGLDEESLVYHIPVGRQNTIASSVTQECCWLTSDQALIRHSAMPEAFNLMFRRHAEFNMDWHRYKKDIDAQSVEVKANLDCPIHHLFRVADWLATTYQHRVSRVLKATYLLAALMGFAFILYSDIHSQDEMLYLFLVFFLAGLGIASVAKRREWHRKYIDYRALAEGLRVQSYWRRAGIVDNNTPSFAHDNFLQKQDIELGWIRNIMRAASIDGLIKSCATGAEQVNAVIEEWIGDPEHSGQLKYYSTTSEKRTRLHQRSEMLGNACLWLGITISVVLVIFARLLQDNLQNIMVASMGILSVAAAVHEAYAYKKADKELIKQYRFMQRIFSAAQRRLATCSGIIEQRQILRTLGEAALAEHAEWTLMHRERPLEHTRI